MIGTRAAIALPALAAAAAAYALLIEPRRLRVERHTVPVDGLPEAATGRRIALLTDLHLGGLPGWRGQARRAIQAAARERPDLILIAGDITHGGQAHGLALLAPLPRLAPVLAVLGNHDHLGGAAAAADLEQALGRLGVRVLNNAHAPSGIAGLPWLIVGVDDWATGYTDLMRAVTGIAPFTPILALLTHVPDIADHVPSEWFPLILAGHTHGLRLRLGPVAALPWVRRRTRLMRSRYPRGFYHVKQSLLYVSRGAGMSELPLRLGSIPEVTVLTLRPA